MRKYFFDADLNTKELHFEIFKKLRFLLDENLPKQRVKYLYDEELYDIIFDDDPEIKLKKKLNLER